MIQMMELIKEKRETMKKLNEIQISKRVVALIMNCTSLICFTILAITFRKWWLIFISILFYQSFKEKNNE